MNKFVASEPWFAIENYGTMENKNMVLRKKAMVLYRKIWYYTENFINWIYSGQNYGTMEKLWYYSKL